MLLSIAAVFSSVDGNQIKLTSSFAPKMSGLSLRSFFFYCLLLECVVLLGADDSSKRCQNTRVVVDFLIKAGLPVSVDEVYKDFKAIGKYWLTNTRVCIVDHT